MSWQMHRWVWRLQGPLHVGYPPAGSLNRTRLYVPARALWGAVTAELARGLADQGSFPNYEQVGKMVAKNVRFTYLYPAQQQEKSGWTTWLPRYEEGRGLVWAPRDIEGYSIATAETVADRSFRRLILHGRASTSVAPTSAAAEDGSLRETECIQPFWARQSSAGSGMLHEELEPLFMAGALFVRNDFEHSQALCELVDLFVGGDTRYGLGHIHRELWEKADPGGRGPGFIFTGDCGSDPAVSLEGNEPILAHACASDDGQASGSRELLAGWGRNTSGRQELTHEQTANQRKEEPYWAPGSRFRKVQEWTICQRGLWQACPPPVSTTEGAAP